jgi:hypothetical protein
MDAQTILVLAVLLSAVLYLVIRAIKRSRKSDTCESCQLARKLPNAKTKTGDSKSRPDSVDISRTR